ncbi:hypothetical protein CDL15_Pgr018434 [Punica granatum]|uniref:Uncharacterized protein n=1 Tax=Punica granatum TaxID=22663 RepID=A0A218WYA6_PUNGR|nr:hypothetical protein CDL15_Pgr018434 [Punica granatum]PKI60551.1 hypothetical protein CRG98_019027 [Punica granatum]
MISYPTEDRNSDTHFIQFLEWFRPLRQWEELFTEEARRVRPHPQRDRHVIVLFQQMWYVGPPRRRSTRAQARAQGEPSEFQRTYSSEVWKTLLTNILDKDNEYREFQRIICEKNGVVPQVIWSPGHIPMEWDYQEDYQSTWPSLEQALKEYNEENPPPPAVSQDQQSPYPLPSPDSQDPYSPNQEALMQLENLMQLDLNPPTAGQAQSNSTAQQAAQANDQAGPSGTANLHDLDSWPQPVLPTQSHAREWWDDDLTVEDIYWALQKIRDKQRKMINERVK